MKRTYTKRDFRLMAASEYLDDWWQSRENYMLEVKQLEQLKENLSDVTAINYDNQRLSKTNRHKDLSDRMVLIDEQQTRINKAKAYHDKIDREMTALLSKIPANYRSILKAVYYTNMSLTKAAEFFHYTYRNIQFKHNKALLTVYEVLKQEQLIQDKTK